MFDIDARDLACPEPVIRVKKALESGEREIKILLNSSTSVQNVQRFAKSRGCDVVTTEQDGVFTLEIKQISGEDEKTAAEAPVLLVASDQLGSGDASLGELLMTAFINTLPESKTRPSKILFINRGVFLTTEGSRVLDTLQQLANQGIEIFSCGTCLNHYQLKDKLKVGQVTNMYDTVENLLSAAKVVRI
jgi:selenium metabolism protein YedF